MALYDPTFEHLRWATLASLACAAFLACSSSKPQEPKTMPSQTVTEPAPELEEPPPLPPPIREEEPTKPSMVKVIDPGGTAKKPSNLAEASRLARQQKGTAPPPVVEINDDNLSEYAEGGNVIISVSEPAAPAPALPEDGAAAEEGGTERTGGSSEAAGPRDESYWRNGVLGLRSAWRESLDQIEELELESAALRQRFYLEDDPYIRDTQVKPAWDRVLDRLSQLRKDAARYEERLDAFIADGRQAGALPGWLSEGWELEPAPEERKKYDRDLETHEPIATPIVDQEEDPAGNGGGR